MQRVPSATSEHASRSDNTLDTPHSVIQYGLHDRPSHDGAHAQLLPPIRAAGDGEISPQSVVGAEDGSHGLDLGDVGVDALLLHDRLRRLSIEAGPTVGRDDVPDQRYEHAFVVSIMSPRCDARDDDTPFKDEPHLEDFPNEVLAHVLSYLHPDEYTTIALVSKRFYSLVTTPHAWRTAFAHYFPGHESVGSKQGNRLRSRMNDDIPSPAARKDVRFFTRLTPTATWRSEYLFRTRLLRSLARGKPGAPSSSGSIGSSTRNIGQAGRRTTAVLTYNSKLPWVVTSLHAVFDNGKRPPRAIHGAADLGSSSISDPTTGKVERASLDDFVSFAQIDEVVPGLRPFGLGEGPTAVPNVMDVSQPYGKLAGEGFPGGQPFFRSVHERTGRYLAQDRSVVDNYLDIPIIPELSEAISSVWIAKSSAVPSVTQSMVGMLAGSTLGVLTAYSLGPESSVSRYSQGDMTARWVLSPGVPIVAIKVDDQYSPRRKAARRIWLVALNALGEVFYLSDVPAPPTAWAKGDNLTKQAWYTGRTVSWQLLETTRRQARPNDEDRNAIRGGYSPRSPSNAMKLSKEQLVAEAREIEKFLRHKPAHFRKVCEGWDMERKLEVDFGADNQNGAGEAIFVVDSGQEVPARVQRFMRVESISGHISPMTPPSTAAANAPNSLFGGSMASVPAQPGKPATPYATSSAAAPEPDPASLYRIDDWQTAILSLRNHSNALIKAAALDQSLQALPTSAEATALASAPPASTGTTTPLTADAVADIPGRRARLIAVGTNSGTILVWNARDTSSGKDGDTIQPVRIIQTDSPEISCLALSALYLVHGGSDGLAQAWDPLGSTLGPVRTLNARPSGRVPRHMNAMNPAIRNRDHIRVGAIYLDPSATVLRGILSFGTFLRYWSYSSMGQPTGRKRRMRHSDIHGRPASRRQGGTVAGYIAAEAAELRREQQHRAQEQARLRRRFGVGAFGDLTEEEAIRYAQMISEESFLEEQRRLSTSDTGSAAGLDTASSFSGESATNTLTPEPSLSGFSPPPPPPPDTSDDDFEIQTQRAIRLSLMEGVNDEGLSPQASSSGEFKYQVNYKPGKKKRSNPTSRSSSSSPSASHTPVLGLKASRSSRAMPLPREDDLELAIRLSLEESRAAEVGLGIQSGEEEEAEAQDKGKGRV